MESKEAHISRLSCTHLSLTSMNGGTRVGIIAHEGIVFWSGCSIIETRKEIFEPYNIKQNKYEICEQDIIYYGHDPQAFKNENHFLCFIYR